MKTKVLKIIVKLYLYFIVFTLSFFSNAQTSGESKGFEPRSIDTTLNVTQKRTPTPLKLVQEKTSSSNSSYPITYSKKPGENQIILDKAFYQKELIRIDQHIKAIDNKCAYINSNPEEKIKAQESGWFEKMSSTRTRLTEEREITVQKINSLNK